MNPKTLGTYDPHPTETEPSHTLLRFPFQIDGRDIALGIDEERSNRHEPAGKPHAPLYVFDVTDPDEDGITLHLSCARKWYALYRQ